MYKKAQNSECIMLPPRSEAAGTHWENAIKLGEF